MGLRVSVCVPAMDVRGQLRGPGSFLFTMWILRIELKSSVLEACNFNLLSEPSYWPLNPAIKLKNMLMLVVPLCVCIFIHMA